MATNTSKGVDLGSQTEVETLRAQLDAANAELQKQTALAASLGQDVAAERVENVALRGELAGAQAIVEAPVVDMQDFRDFMETLYAMEIRAREQGASLTGVLIKSASAYFGIDITPPPIAPAAVIDPEGLDAEALNPDDVNDRPFVRTI